MCKAIECAPVVLRHIKDDRRCGADTGCEDPIMSLRNSPDRYGIVSQSLHWLAALLVLAAWLLGTFDDVLPKGPMRDAGTFVHITAGLAVFGLLVLRVVWRAIDPPPAAVTVTGPAGPWMHRAALLAHWLLYALMAAVVVSGIAFLFARGRPLPLFGLGEIASPWTTSRAVARSIKEVHEVLANALLLLGMLHVAAALFHDRILRDRTLARMLPFSRR